MKNKFLPIGLIILSCLVISCRAVNSNRIDKTSVDDIKMAMISNKVHKGSRVWNSFKSIDPIWIINQCRPIRPYTESSKTFALGDRSWDRVLIMEVSGNEVKYLQSHVFAWLLTGSCPERAEKILKSIKFDSVSWQPVRRPTFY
jgi:hypothetical protein